MGKESLLRILTIIDGKGKSPNVQWLCCRMSTSPDITEIFYRTLFVCIEFGLKIWMWETFYTKTFWKKFSIWWAAAEVGGSVLVSWPGGWLTPVCRPVWLCTTVLFSTAENAKLDCKTIPFKLYNLASPQVVSTAHLKCTSDLSERKWEWLFNYLLSWIKYL